MPFFDGSDLIVLGLGESRAGELGSAILLNTAHLEIEGIEGYFAENSRLGERGGTTFRYFAENSLLGDRGELRSAISTEGAGSWMRIEVK
ncbi:hypothetical protein J2Z65_002860 [Paenibacillus aceris]|uniref:Uncharacterized protein n=1 Tax=Paenibacillus aceris TaxID=869555 RepID=A0ABS4HZC6_9BACL|nr:hypothetical protein [Paenibacillus aceris]